MTIKMILNIGIFILLKKTDCDTYICIGYNINRQNIDNVWIIPNDDENSNLARFKIAKNLYKTSKYDKFKVDPKLYNEIYHDLMEYFKDKKYFGVEDIKNWILLRKEKKKN